MLNINIKKFVGFGVKLNFEFYRLLFCEFSEEKLFILQGYCITIDNALL